MNFISEEQIKIAHWLYAENLVADVDPKDIHFVAYSKQFRCKIWCGDKKIIAGLSKKGFKNFNTTNDLYKIVSG